MSCARSEFVIQLMPRQQRTATCHETKANSIGFSQQFVFFGKRQATSGPKPQTQTLMRSTNMPEDSIGNPKRTLDSSWSGRTLGTNPPFGTFLLAETTCSSGTGRVTRKRVAELIPPVDLICRSSRATRPLWKEDAGLATNHHDLDLYVLGVRFVLRHF